MEVEFTGMEPTDMEGRLYDEVIKSMDSRARLPVF